MRGQIRREPFITQARLAVSPRAGRGDHGASDWDGVRGGHEGTRGVGWPHGHTPRTERSCSPEASGPRPDALVRQTPPPPPWRARHLSAPKTAALLCVTSSYLQVLLGEPPPTPTPARPPETAGPSVGQSAGHEDDQGQARSEDQSWGNPERKFNVSSKVKRGRREH